MLCKGTTPNPVDYQSKNIKNGSIRVKVASSQVACGSRNRQTDETRCMHLRPYSDCAVSMLVHSSLDRRRPRGDRRCPTMPRRSFVVAPKRVPAVGGHPQMHGNSVALAPWNGQHRTIASPRPRISVDYVLIARNQPECENRKAPRKHQCFQRLPWLRSIHICFIDTLN